MTKPPEAKAKAPRAASLSKATVALLRAFGRNVKAARAEAAISQRALAALTGISQHHISEIERGAVNVSISTIAEMSLHLGKTPAELLTPPPPRTRKR
jgi:transcriptional regulator with XRE-family HTH domain